MHVTPLGVSSRKARTPRLKSVKWRVIDVHRCFKRHSRAALNRQLEMAHFPTPPQLRLFDYLQKRKERKPAPSIDLKISKAGNVGH